MTLVDQIFFFRAACVSNNKNNNCFSCITSVKVRYGDGIAFIQHIFHMDIFKRALQHFVGDFCQTTL